jgi:hypothetical protein
LPHTKRRHLKPSARLRANLHKLQRRLRNQPKRQKIKLLTRLRGSLNKIQRQQLRNQPQRRKMRIEQAQSIRRLRSRMVKSRRRKAPTKNNPECRDNHANLRKRNCPTTRNVWHPLSRGFTRGSANMDGDGTTVIMGLPNIIMSLPAVVATCLHFVGWASAAVPP